MNLGWSKKLKSKLPQLDIAGNGSVISLPNITYVPLKFDILNYAFDIAQDTTDLTKIIIREAGIYSFSVMASFESAAGLKNITCIKNGLPNEVTDAPLADFVQESSSVNYITLSFNLKLLSSDFVQFYGWQSTGKTIAIKPRRLTIVKVSD